MGTPSRAFQASLAISRGNNNYSLPTQRPNYLPYISSFDRGGSIRPTNSFSTFRVNKAGFPLQGETLINKLTQEDAQLEAQKNSIKGNDPHAIAYRQATQAVIDANVQARKQLGGQLGGQALLTIGGLTTQTAVRATNIPQVSSTSKYQQQALNTLPSYLQQQAQLNKQIFGTSNVNANRIPNPVLVKPQSVASSAIRPKFNSPSSRGIVITNSNPSVIPSVIPSSIANQRQPTIVGGRNRPNFSLSINQGVVPTSNGSTKNYIPSNAMRAPNMMMMNGNVSLLNAILRCF